MGNATDVGYILGRQAEYEELRYSLRSLPLSGFDIGQVWVAGAPPPDWSKNIRHIPVEQARTDNRREPGNDWWANRKTNMRRNLLALLDSPDVSDEFLYMNDDFIFVDEIGPLPHLGTFQETHKYRINEKQGAYPDLFEWFVDQGIEEPLHVSEHVPMLVDSRLAAMMREVWHITGFPYASLWGNLTEVETVRGGPDIRDGDWVLRHQRDQMYDWPDHWWSVSTVSRSFHDWPVGEKIRALFPEPSRWEKNGDSFW